MIIFRGYPFEVYAVAYYHVVMDHKSKDDAEDEAYLATDTIFDNDTGIKVLDTKVTKVERQKYFDIAEVKMELRIDLTAFDVDDAFRDAEDMIRGMDLPVGVSLYDCEAYNHDWRNEMVVEV